MTKSPQETYVISDNSGLPPAMIMHGGKELLGKDLYALLDGDNLQHYKFGYEADDTDNTRTLPILKTYFPSKYDKLIHV